MSQQFLGCSKFQGDVMHKKLLSFLLFSFILQNQAAQFGEVQQQEGEGMIFGQTQIQPYAAQQQPAMAIIPQVPARSMACDFEQKMVYFNNQVSIQSTLAQSGLVLEGDFPGNFCGRHFTLDGFFRVFKKFIENHNDHGKGEKIRARTLLAVLLGNGPEAMRLYWDATESEGMEESYYCPNKK